MRKLVIGLAIGLAAVGIAATLGFTAFVQDVELKTYDRRVRWTANPAEARRDIAIVEINEDSERRLEPLVGRWPWPRLVHADLIDYLARAPARVIAYDILFTDRDRRSGFPVGDETWTGAESDQALVASTMRAGNVVHLAEATFEGVGPQVRLKPDTTAEAAMLPVRPKPDATHGTAAAVSSSGVVSGFSRAPAQDAQVGSKLLDAYALDDTIEERPTLLLPVAELARASRALGHNYFVFDADGPLRHVVPFIRVGRQFVPSLGMAAAMLAAGVEPHAVHIDRSALWIGPRRMPLRTVDVPQFDRAANGPRRGRRALIRFAGPAVLADGHSSTYQTYSFYDLFYSQQQLLSGQAPLVDPAVFRNKIVLVGTSAAGLHDVFTSPFGSTGKMIGAHVHAAVVDDVLSERFMEPAGWAAALMTLLCSGLAAGVAAALVPVWASVAIASAAAALVATIGIGLFSRGLWLPMAQPAVAIGLSLFGGVAYQYFVEGREKRRVKQVFGRYVSREVFNQLMADPTRARLGGERRQMTVLFSDIRGFTTVTEQREPDAVVAQLNEFFSRMVDVIFRHGGTIDKFVGDMVMALFGAPLDDAAHADHAVAAAVEMAAALDGLNAAWAAEGRATLDIGIGINSGEMIAGNIGSERIMSYTVIGDAVNLGARLESLNKEYGTRIIISEATRALLRGSYSLRPLGQVVVKGRTQAADIYAVESGKS